MAQPQTAAVEVWRTLGPRRLAAAALGIAAVAVGLVFLPGRFTHVDDQVSALAAMTPQERSLRFARGADVDTGIYLLAQRLLPPDARYYVLTGKGVGVSTPVTFDAVAPGAVFFLMPRHAVSDPKLADWVLSYGGDLRTLGVRIGRVWIYKPGLEVAQVAR